MNPVTKAYIASHFNKTIKPDDTGFTLEEDFRDKAIKSLNPDRGLMDYSEDAFVRYKGKRLNYVGPFYNEKASSGEFTSTDCIEVVATEKRLVEECDVFIAYLDNDISPGSLSELIYAAIKNKKIVIFYDIEETIYSLKSTNWFPITFVKSLTHDIDLIPIKDYSELEEYFK